MKTTVELPDELMRVVKIRAVNEGRRLKDLMAELVWRGLAENSESPPRAPARVRVPLVQCVHAARPEDEMTPDRVALILSQEEAQALRQ